MSRGLKVGLILLGLLVTLVIALTVLVKLYITPERVRDALLPLAENALHRQVEVDRIDIGIFSGISLADLKVKKKAAEGDFVSIKKLELRYQLLPLLRGQLVINKVLLEQPEIEIVRLASGDFNFSDLLVTEKKQGSRTEQPIQKEVGSDGKSSGLDLLVDDVSISQGKILFVDAAVNAKAPHRLRLEQFSFSATKITNESSFPFKASAVLNGSKLNLAGNVDLKKNSSDLDLQLGSLALTEFAPYYRQHLPGKLTAGTLTLNLEVQLHSDLIESKGVVRLAGLDLLLDDLPDAALQQADVGIDYAVSFAPKTGQLDISTLFFNLNKAVVGVEGQVKLADPKPRFALSLLLNDFDLDTLFKALPAGLVKNYQEYRPAGQLTGRISLAGAAGDGARLLQTVDLELKGVEASVADQRPKVSGRLNYADQQLQSKDLLINVAEQRMAVSFSASEVLSKTIKGSFRITAETLDLNPLLPQEKSSRQTEKKPPVVKRQPTLAEDIGPFDLPLDMTGTLQVGKLLYKKLNLDQVRAELLLKDNHLKIVQLRSGVAGGEFIMSSDIDLGVKGLQYQGQMKLDQSNLMTLINGFAPQASQNVSGLLQWQNNFSGRGTLPDVLLRSLQVKGLLQLSKGRVSDSPVLNQLATFLGVPDLKIFDFDIFESRYDLRDGLARLSGQMNGSKARLIPEGTIGVDGSLNLKLDTRIAPELMQKLGVKTGLKQAVSDQDGWGKLPLLLKGSLTSPKLAFDTAVLQKQATDKVKGEVSKRLLEKVIPEGGDKEPVKQLLEGTLNKLFGN